MHCYVEPGSSTPVPFGVEHTSMAVDATEIMMSCFKWGFVTYALGSLMVCAGVQFGLKILWNKGIYRGIDDS